MKKIFAIALALVMVLSMASAFAAANIPGVCGTTWDWSCTSYTAKCGVAKAEVVLFTKGNNCYDRYTASDCAGVVIGEHLFWGVKIVFDADVNEQWFNHANTKLTFSYKDINNAYGTSGTAVGGGSLVLSRYANYSDVKKGGTFWVTNITGGFRLVKDADFDETTCIFDGWATSTKAKVCADVEYSFNGMGKLNNADIDFGQYTAYFNDADSSGKVSDGDYIKVTNKTTNDVAYFGIKDGKIATITITENGITKTYNAYANGLFYGYKGNTATVVASNTITSGEACSFLPAMMQFFGLNFGTCITNDSVEANFGWDDDNAFESCKTWNKDAVAIANAACQVAIEIPKTGDASVIAYAVMALVAAAGAMGLKK